jgi:16S rRNA (cytosine1402-N4)-methyltransferase
MTKLLHTPIMLYRVVEYLAPAPGKKFIDATLGYAGHTLALLEKGASVIGIDQDADMLEMATARIAEGGFADRFTPMHSSFSGALSGDRIGEVDGILFDLGVSSYQLDTPKRGFSFRYDAPLDMRMDRSLAVTAKDLINGLGKKELIALFKTLGEEKAALKIVEAIIDQRKIKPIETTKQLADLVSRVTPGNGRVHPATKVFQALRMAVNTEREELKAALPSALSHLALGGVMALLSFHSLEDEIIDLWIATELKNGTIKLVTPSPESPSVNEVTGNPRSRSAKLRVIERIK